MSPQLQAFLVSSGGAGVSAQAVEQWAVRQRLNPHTQLRQLRRAAARGQVCQRAGAGFARVAVSVVYYVPPARPGEQNA